MDFRFYLPVTIVLLAFAGVALIIYIVSRASGRQRQLLNAERMAAMDRGVDLPPEAFFEDREEKESALKNGLIFLAGGAGLSLALWLVSPGSGHWGWGVLVSLVGLAYIVYWFAGGKRDWEEARKLDREMKQAWIRRQSRVGSAGEDSGELE
jgi:hypothetical protein